VVIPLLHDYGGGEIDNSDLGDTPFISALKLGVSRPLSESRRPLVEKPKAVKLILATPL
jgi:hypothetical protein